jgi:hypothetical protein
MSKRWSVLLLPLCVMQPACSSVEGACERIVDACHDADTGAGPAHDCHELAEVSSATDEACSDREDECLEICGH